ncbi:hypothetical protein Mapa_017221 [Marchantia paleacea]|nr:hypothetical protein Mapa_017221 [Marchantia paleacea]
MTSNISVIISSLVFLVDFSSSPIHAADPEEIRDFAPPPPCTPLDSEFFTFTKYRNIVINQTQFATVTPANVGMFPALSVLGIFNAFFTFPPGSVNVPRTHPRGTEILFVLEDCLEVGLTDTTEPVPNLFTQRLEKGDIFVFP